MYDWDEQKRKANLAKHGVDFADADRFDWSRATTEADTRHDYGEARIIATAPIGTRICVLTYTPRHNRLRIINLRKANKREIAKWERKRAEK